MDHARLTSLLDHLEDITILVVGDFFLDRYLIIDPDIAETSIETGLEAQQVVEIRNSPGAAGTVTNNLSALGVGRILALGVIGDDGHGFDLTQELHATRVDTSNIIRSPARYTPTYTKRINRKSASEMERLDVKNRTTTPAEIEKQVVDRLTALYPQADGIIVLDQVPEANCGVLTDTIRGALSELAVANDRPVLADSRTQISQFENVILKPNATELQAVTGDGAETREAVRSLASRTGRPVIGTRGSDGIITSDGDGVWEVPGVDLPEPLDIVGAGDSVSAAVTSALGAGASLLEASVLGIMASSITVQQIGTTGTASPDQILDRFSSVYPNGFVACT